MGTARRLASVTWSGRGHDDHRTGSGAGRHDKNNNNPVGDLSLTVKVGFAAPVAWLTAGEGASVLLPMLTPSSECPCRPGAAGPLPARCQADGSGMRRLRLRIRVARSAKYADE